MQIGYKKLVLICIIYFSASTLNAQNRIINADERLQEYLPLLRNRMVAILSNQSAIINKKHLVDILLSEKIDVVKIFSPEHGFRGNADAGSEVKNQIDKKTKLPIISLYGDNKKPSDKDLENVDIVLFDIQDVGVRFFTFISTLTYAMEACALNGKRIIVLDRPNPNAGYVDGPVLEQNFKSFVGMHPVPIVYGMTIGEYAKMINGEHWLPNNLTCDLQVIEVLNYKHGTRNVVTIPPSPNLNSELSILAYPSLCLFEGTVVSVGRGTKMPFTVYGHPNFMNGEYYFTPKSIKNMSTNPPYKNIKCRGFNLDNENELLKHHFSLAYLINAYAVYPEKDKFFNNFFNKLTGNELLKQQIVDGISENEIRKTWEFELDKFKQIRKKYLIYEE